MVTTRTFTCPESRAGTVLRKGSGWYGIARLNPVRQIMNLPPDYGAQGLNVKFADEAGRCEASLVPQNGEIWWYVHGEKVHTTGGIGPGFPRCDRAPRAAGLVGPAPVRGRALRDVRQVIRPACRLLVRQCGLLVASEAIAEAEEESSVRRRPARRPAGTRGAAAGAGRRGTRPRHGGRGLRPPARNGRERPCSKGMNDRSRRFPTDVRTGRERPSARDCNGAGAGGSPPVLNGSQETGRCTVKLECAIWLQVLLAGTVALAVDGCPNPLSVFNATVPGANPNECCGQRRHGRRQPGSAQ